MTPASVSGKLVVGTYPKYLCVFSLPFCHCEFQSPHFPMPDLMNRIIWTTTWVQNLASSRIALTARSGSARCRDYQLR